MLAPFFIFLGIDLIFIILAILFFCGKGSSLIAGYNTASKAERAKYDEKALCRAMGWLMVALAVCWFIIALNLLLDNLVFLWARDTRSAIRSPYCELSVFGSEP